MSAETYRDAWGIPHLRADSPVELARAQGRVTALDRGWQLEVERHRAEGTSAAFLGPEALSWDRLARRARLADTARRCFIALEEKDAETAAWVRAYVDGVNEGLVRHPDGSGSPNGFGSPGGSGTWDGSGHRGGSGTRDGSGHRGGSGTWDGSGHRDGSGTWDGSGHRGGSGTRDGSGHRGGSGTRDGSGHRGGSGTWDGSGHRDGSGGREGPGGRDGSGHRGDHPRPRDASRRRDGLGRRSDLRTPSVPPAPEFARAALAPGRWEPWTPLAVWLATHILFAGFPAKLWREHITTRLGPDAAALFAADGPGTTGSNGWLLSGGRTTTGHALIAGDPHRWIEDPGVYQQIHLSCPEFDVVGLAVPGVPGIAHFGHTGTVAWAITNAMSDYQDLYRERLRRTGVGVEALGPDGTWRRAARHTETIRVAGEGTEERTGETAEVEVIETDRGPVIAGGPEGLDDGTPDALSLRYPPRVTSDLGFGALLPLLRARTVADVDRALDAWAEPVNVVQAADTEGGLLHRVAGRVPVRAAVNGLRPVPAWEPGHEWTGWHTPPRADVDDGVAVMANQRGLATPLGVEFAAPHRADRIAALLAAERRWSAADLPAIHTDTHLGSAGPLLDHLAALTGLSPEAAALRDRVLAWDRRMDAHSVGAAAYAAVRGALVRRLAAHPVLAPASVAPAYPEVLQPWLALVPRVAYALEHLLRADDLYGIDRAAAVGAALEEAAACPPAGPWGDTHRLASWRALPDPAARTGEPGLSGDHDCVLCTSSVPGLTDRAARGPAARYVWDLADRGNSRWVVPHGACGTPGSPHHRDQQPLWLAGELAPVITDFDRLTLTEETDV